MILKVRFRTNLPDKYPRNDIITQRLDAFLTTLEKEFYKSLHEVIKKQLRHTQSHGWNYTYTGRLARSFYTKERKLDPENLNARLVIASNHIAARILQTGGKITPKRAHYLTVPLSSASSYGFSLEAQKNLLRSGELIRIGNLLYIKILGAKIPIAVLKAAVRIPPYMYITKTLKRVIRNFR